MVLKGEPITIKRQCELLGVNRASFYYKPRELEKSEAERVEFISQRIEYHNTNQCYLGAKKTS